MNPDTARDQSASSGVGWRAGRPRWLTHVISAVVALAGVVSGVVALVLSVLDRIHR